MAYLIPPKIKMVPIISSHLSKVGYDLNNKTLYVTFKSKSKNSRVTKAPWKYFPVEKEIFEGLLSASSSGSYFHKNIKNAPNISSEEVKFD